MKHASLEYLKRRATEELQEANSASSKGVAKVHRAMADAFYLQIRKGSAAELRWVDDGPPDPTTISPLRENQ